MEERRTLFLGVLPEDVPLGILDLIYNNLGIYVEANENGLNAFIDIIIKDRHIVNEVIAVEEY
jgi:hypothetical protein